MRENFLTFSPPNLGVEESEEVAATLRTDWITTGPKTRQFEERFAALVGSSAALAVFSATNAMELALVAMGVAPEDEIITTAMTFCSTAHVIEHLRARPVLVDVEPDTLNLDPTKVAAALTRKTKGILPVHLYGHPCDMDALLKIAESNGLFVLEDAAHALPARYRGRMVGSIGTATAFSFYATKNITTAEGGMLTGATELIEKARVWSLHGMSRDAYDRYSREGSWFYEVVVPGFKCNMTDIQASLGLQQLKKLPAFQKRRREIVARYHQAFSQMPPLQMPVERPEVESAWHLYVVRLRLEMLRIDRNQFIEELKARKIGASVHFIPIHLHRYYRETYGYAPDDYPVAYREYQRMVSLPLHPGLTNSDVEDVVEAVRDILQRFGR